ncbi:class A beta-lactamase [Actinoplanes bogorensis]|uniref:Class A beta-lactamase n=1 Tax=Paractinoplanes bogorensis TaxID=1610840 RepID=A0ABS5YXI6_9ACTN|nr:class A beta-lactamase [Actinoplanes bogorensis]MBU2668141.1 class A beta-lactamase [Actinoplanes bogorensis]
MMRFARLVLAVAVLSGCSGADSDAAPPAPPSSSAPPAPVSSPAPALPLSGLEKQFGARVGVHAIDTASGRTMSYRADERFAHASTFKALLAGVLLRRMSDDDRRRVIAYGKTDLLEWAPITAKHVSTGMTIDALIAAAVQYSDNTAANLLLEQIGGPAGLQRELRAIGDKTTIVSRSEPTLNEATPGDKRDTSTPRALAEDLRRMVLGDVLPPDRRDKLTELLVGNTTGDALIRAGVPTGWKVGDKTGSGGHGTRNDIAVVWPPTGGPLVIAVQTDGGTGDDALIAAATKAVVSAIA